jgi:transcriptional regulator with AAA-type ATPase domain
MSAALLKPQERRFAEAVSGLGFGNPFLPERIEFEKQALGDDFVAGAAVWSLDSEYTGDNPNSLEVHRRGELLAERLRQRLASGQRADGNERQLYADVVIYVLYYRYQERFYQEIIAAAPGRAESRRMGFYRAFRDDVRHFFDVPGLRPDPVEEPAHLFALFFQVRRAFHHIFHYILGGSLAAAGLRAAAWQSIFTHDPRRYRRSLYDRMHEISTLITGPSGTGKDLVASAIGFSGYIAFDPDREAFVEDFRSTHLGLSLSALSPTLIESELFGHCKGSFTGATSDRAGYLEGRGPMHSVFLDEIGDLDPGIQVKLLRVLQTREFQRIGEVKPRNFGGKIIAATNRNLAFEMHAGRFREDLYYRLCSDLVETPTLQEQTRGAPHELHNLVLLLARRLVAESDAEAVAAEVTEWIETELGPDYRWRGNVRELEQCVRNVLVHGHYRPLEVEAEGGPLERLFGDIRAGSLTADELLSRYCTLVYSQTGQYEATARRVELDRRTVKRRIDPELLAALRQGGE